MCCSALPVNSDDEDDEDTIKHIAQIEYSWWTFHWHCCYLYISHTHTQCGANLMMHTKSQVHICYFFLNLWHTRHIVWRECYTLDFSQAFLLCLIYGANNFKYFTLKMYCFPPPDWFPQPKMLIYTEGPTILGPKECESDHLGYWCWLWTNNVKAANRMCFPDKTNSVCGIIFVVVRLVSLIEST